MITPTTQDPHPVSPTSAVALPRQDLPWDVRGKRLDIQGLRAFAVAVVVFEHAHLGFPGGFIGVDVFFAISGFVIGHLLLREVATHDRVRLGRFYARRVMRLLPVLAVVTVITALLSIALVSPLGPQHKAAVTGGAASLWSSNIALYGISGDYFAESVRTNPFLHTWSLGVEEQFYLIFPLVIWGLWVLGRKVKRTVLIPGVALLGLCSFALSAYLSFGNFLPGIAQPGLFAFYMMPARLWEFAAGFLLAACLGSARLPRAWALPLVLAGTITLVFSALWIDNSMPFPGVVALLPVLGTLAVISGGKGHNALSRIWATKPLVYLGDISYSLYLWHWPAIVFTHRVLGVSVLSSVLAIALALVLSHLTYHHVEQRFRAQGGQRVTLRDLRVPALGVVSGGAASAVLLVGALTSWGLPSLKETSAELLQRPARQDLCLNTTPVTSRDTDACTWGAERPGEPIYLMGDSNSQMHTEALIAASEELERPLTIASTGGCPLIRMDYQIPGNPAGQAICERYVDSALEWLSNQPSGQVVMASSGEWLNMDTVQFVADNGQLATDARAKSPVWSKGLAATSEEVRAAGHEPVLVETTPHLAGSLLTWWNPIECQNWTLLSQPDACGTSVALEEERSRLAPVYDAEIQAAQETNTRYLRVVDDLCPGGVCAANRDGEWIYRDGLHISPQGARSLAASFIEGLQP